MFDLAFKRFVEVTCWKTNCTCCHRNFYGRCTCINTR